MTKFLCWANIIIIVAAVLTGILESGMYPETSDGIYAILGLAMFVTVPWLAIRVLMTLK